MENETLNSGGFFLLCSAVKRVTTSQIILWGISSWYNTVTVRTWLLLL